MIYIYVVSRLECILIFIRYIVSCSRFLLLLPVLFIFLGSVFWVVFFPFPFFCCLVFFPFSFFLFRNVSSRSFSFFASVGSLFFSLVLFRF